LVALHDVTRLYNGHLMARADNDRRAFSVAAATIWNSLLVITRAYVRLCQSVITFTRLPKTHFSLPYPHPAVRASASYNMAIYMSFIHSLLLLLLLLLLIYCGSPAQSRGH